MLACVVQRLPEHFECRREVVSQVDPTEQEERLGPRRRAGRSTRHALPVPAPRCFPTSRDSGPRRGSDGGRHRGRPEA